MIAATMILKSTEKKKSKMDLKKQMCSNILLSCFILKDEKVRICVASITLCR